MMVHDHRGPGEKKNTHTHTQAHAPVEKLAILVASRCNFLKQ